MEIKFPGLEKLGSAIIHWISKDRRKVLPYSEGVIGTHSVERLNVAIFAKIFLLETVRPPVDEFLARLRLGDPYCCECSRPLDLWRASWMANGIQIGYKCPNCGSEIKKDWPALSKEVSATVRKAYDSYWSNYQKEIMALTQSKPHKYRLP